MIFVTVGTHEQPFDRLLAEVDRLAATGGLPEPTFCQTGYSSVTPAGEHARFLPFDEIQRRISQASVVVTHGGPGSIMPALSAGKPVVLVPRRRRFGEHVDDHQVAFCDRLHRTRGLPLVLEIDTLGAAIHDAIGQNPGRLAGMSAAGVAIHRLNVLIEAARSARRRS